MKRNSLAALASLATGSAALALIAPPASAPAASSGQRHVVPMANMTFGKIPRGIKAGDTIVWVNRDSVPHTVTARNRSFDLRLNPGQSKAMTLSKPGSFAIYCIYHPAMRGTIAVSAS